MYFIFLNNTFEYLMVLTINIILLILIYSFNPS